MAAAEKKEEAAPAPAAPDSGGGGGGSSKLVMILTLVNMVATVGMFAVLFLSYQSEKKRASVTDMVTQEEGHGAPAEGGHGAPAGGGHGDSHGGGGKKGNSRFGKMITLDQFTVNLTTPGSTGSKFVRVNISLEVPSDDAEGEVTQKMPQIRNVIIDLFNSKRTSDLATSEGRDYLKEEIKNAVNSFMVTGKIKGVFFTNFAVTS